MSNHSNDTSRRDRWLQVVLWLPGLLVALGAAAATAHGLFEVAAATDTPPVIAGLYPVITDGLALVAYAATPRLAGNGRRYAWTVVVLAAGLSGIAQAAYLAGASGHASTPLRMVIGAWPAIAAAIVAHLLFLIGHADRQHTNDPTTTTPVAATEHVEPEQHADPTPPAGVQPCTVQPPVQPGTIQPAVQSTVQSDVQPPARPEAGPGAPAPSSAEQTTPVPPIGEHVQPPVDEPAEPPAKTRATDAARRYREQHGHLPTVSKLAALAEVSRGTAGEALKPLREQPTPLHLVTHQPADQRETQADKPQQEANQ